jgi:hypothetical protein
VRSLRPSKFLLLAGFVGVIACSICDIVGFANFTSGSWIVDQLAPPIGYGLVGLAWWQWTPASQAGSVGSKAMRRSSRTLALASVVTSLAYFSILYGNLRFRYAQHDPNFYLPHFNLRNDGYGAAGLGFVLAAVGFWIAPKAAQVANSPVDSDLVTATP